MTAAMPTQSDIHDEHLRLPLRVRIGQGVLTTVLIACALVALSTMFVDDPFEPAAVVLIASFGTLAAALGLAAVWGGVRSRTVRLGLWALPLFFVWHVAALGTWIPDAVLAVVAASGVMLVTGPTASQREPESR